MRILADENFPRQAGEALRARGHDVAWARTNDPGKSDTVVVDRGTPENRLIITFDKDFGELAYRRGLYSIAGIILFRINMSAPQRAAQCAVKAGADDLLNWNIRDFKRFGAAIVRLVKTPLVI